jgi:hypothetical protein
MHVKQFRKDAIEGGITEYEQFRTSDPEMLLNPDWWRAVGKTRGWLSDAEWFEPEFTPKKPWWKSQWHQFIDHLAEGDDYETALSKLL